MRRSPLLLPIIAAILVARSMLVAFPLGHDALEYPVRQVEFHECLRQGILWPQWAPDLSNGFGQPLFVFSPPLFYWLAEPFYALGLPLHRALPMAVFVLLLLSALFAYRLGKELWGSAGGTLVAVAYVSAPYVSLNCYVRTAWAETAALPAYPLAMLAILHMRRPGVMGVLLGALSLAWAAASHHPAFLMLTGAYVVAGVLLACFERSAALAGRVLLGLLLGTGAAAVFWLPALTEMQHTNVDRLLEGGLDYRKHFVAVWQLLWSSWGTGLSVAGTGDGMSYRVGIVPLLLAILAWITAWRRGPPRVRTALAWLSILAIGSALMSTSASRWLWDALPLLQYIQFPWRILGITALLLATLVGGLAQAARPALAMWAASVLLIGAALPIATMPAAQRSGPFDDAFYSPERIAAAGMTTTTREEFTPKTCQHVPSAGERQARWLNDDVAPIHESARTAISRHYEVPSRGGGALLVPILWFPGWTATVDGREVSVRVEPVHGRMIVDVPPGAEQVMLRFGAAGSRSWAHWISIVSILSAALALLLVVRSRTQGLVCPKGGIAPSEPGGPHAPDSGALGV